MWRRDGQQQDSQCPDAGGGLWVCRTANRDKGMAWAWWEEQQWLARSDPNGQPERRKWGWGELGGLQVPEGSLPAHRSRNSPVRAQPSFQICSLLSHSPAPSDPRPRGCAHPVPTTQDTACGSHLCQPLRSPLGHRCLFTLVSVQGRGAVLRETSLSRTLHPGAHFPPAEGLG